MFSMSVIFLMKPYFFVFSHQHSDVIDSIIEKSVICTIFVFNAPDQKESEVQLYYSVCVT